MKVNIKYISNIILVILILLLFTKFQFRLTEFQYGYTNDDHSYYYHLKTVIEDRDLDYSNQFKNANIDILYKDLNGNVKPNHPIGIAILSFPIYLTGYLVDFNFEPSFQYFLYSFTQIIYLLLTIKVLKKLFLIENLEIDVALLYLLILGSGVVYYAFNRFSMTPVYEIFAFATIFLISSLVCNRYKYFIFLPILQFLFLTIRFTNYHLFLIPILYVLIFKKKLKEIYNLKYLIGFLLGLAMFLTHTKILYGIFTLNPSKIYVNLATTEPDPINRYLSLFDLSLFDLNLLTFFKTIKVVFFSQEFGFIFYSPILFITLYIFYFLIKIKNFRLSLIYTFSFLVSIFPIYIYQSAAASYGYRYFFSFIPINIVIFFKLKIKRHIILNYLKYFSILSLILILFFESSNLSVLSTIPQKNSFGNEVLYSNKYILSGTIKSIFLLESYIKIVFTSFLGILIIKLINFFKDPVFLINQITDLKDREVEYITDFLNYPTTYLIIVICFYYFIARSLYSKK